MNKEVLASKQATVQEIQEKAKAAKSAPPKAQELVRPRLRRVK